jgi:hypothetical protein
MSYGIVPICNAREIRYFHVTKNASDFPTFFSADSKDEVFR